MGTHSDGYVEQELLTTFVTCEGDLSDPQFNTKFARLLKQLQKLLLKDSGQYLGVVKVEPWNSVRVTFTVPKEAALRLRQLAQQGDATLSQLGILSVQLEGDQAISLRIAGRVSGESQEIVLRTTPADNESIGSQSAAPEADHMISKNVVVSASGGTASFIRTMTQLVSGSAMNQPLSSFKSPSVVSPMNVNSSFSVSPKVSSAVISTATKTTIPHSYHSPFLPARPSPAVSSAQSREPLNNLGASSPRFPLPPPPPYPNAKNATTSHMIKLNRTASEEMTTNPSPANVALSSPLLVNLLQNDGGVPLNNCKPPTADKPKMKPSVKPAAPASTAKRKDSMPETLTNVNQSESADPLSAASASTESQVIQRIQRATASVSEPIAMVTNVRIPVESCNSESVIVSSGKLPAMNHLTVATANVKQNFANQSQLVNIFQGQLVAAGSNAASGAPNPQKTALMASQFLNRVATVPVENQQILTVGQAPKLGVRVINVSSQQQSQPHLLQSQHLAATKQILQQQQQQPFQQHTQQQLLIQQQPSLQLLQQQKSVISQSTPSAKINVSTVQELNKLCMNANSPVVSSVMVAGNRFVNQFALNSLSQQVSNVLPGSNEQRLDAMIADRNSALLAESNALLDQVDKTSIAVANTTTMPVQMQNIMIADGNTCHMKKSESAATSLPNGNRVLSFDSIATCAALQLVKTLTFTNPTLSQVTNSNNYNNISLAGIPGVQETKLNVNAKYAPMLAPSQMAQPTIVSSGPGAAAFGSSASTYHNNTIVTNSSAVSGEKYFDPSMLHKANQLNDLQAAIVYAKSEATANADACKVFQPAKGLAASSLPHAVNYVASSAVTTTAFVADNQQPSVYVSSTIQLPPPPQYSSPSGGLSGGVAACESRKQSDEKDNNCNGAGTSVGDGTRLPEASPAGDKEPQFLINPLTGEMEAMPTETSDNESDQPTDVFNSLPPSVANNDDSCFSYASPMMNEKSSSMYSDDDDDLVSSSALKKGDEHSNGVGDPMKAFNGADAARHRALPAGSSPNASGAEKIKIRLKLEKSEPISSNAYKVDVLNSGLKKVDKPTSIVKPMPRVLTTSASSTSHQNSIVSSAVEEPRVPPIRLSLRGKNLAFVKKNKKWAEVETKEALVEEGGAAIEKRGYFKSKLSPCEVISEKECLAAGDSLECKLAKSVDGGLEDGCGDELKLKLLKGRKSAEGGGAVDDVYSLSAEGGAGDAFSSYGGVLPSVRTFPTEAEVASILRSVPTDPHNKMSLSSMKIKKKESKKKFFTRDRGASSILASAANAEDAPDAFARVINETKCSLSSQGRTKTKSTPTSLLKKVMKSGAADARFMNIANRSAEKRVAAAAAAAAAASAPAMNFVASEAPPGAVAKGAAGSAAVGAVHQRRSSADVTYSVSGNAFAGAKSNPRSSEALVTPPPQYQPPMSHAAANSLYVGGATNADTPTGDKPTKKMGATAAAAAKKVVNNCKTREYQNAVAAAAAAAAKNDSKKDFLLNHEPKKSHFAKKNAPTEAVDGKAPNLLVNCVQTESASACTPPNVCLADKQQRLLADDGEPARKKARLEVDGAPPNHVGALMDHHHHLLMHPRLVALPAGKDVEMGGGGIGDDSPSAHTAEQTNNQGEDSGIESMDALSEKSPNQGESPCRKEEKESGGGAGSGGGEAAAADKKSTVNAYCDKTGAESFADDGYGRVGDDREAPKAAGRKGGVCEAAAVDEEGCKSAAAPLQLAALSGLEAIGDEEAGADKGGDCKATFDEGNESLSPDLDDVQPFRVTPALYTYSNPEKMRVDSPSPVLEDITDEISLSPKSVVVEQPKTSTRLKRKRKESSDPVYITTDRNKTGMGRYNNKNNNSLGGKSLLEQLLIEIPSDNSVEIRRSGMSTRNTRSQVKGLSQPSPDTLSVCSTSSSSSIRTPKCSPVSRVEESNKPSPRPSSRLTSRRSRKGSESSNVSNSDESSSYGGGKRKTTESASELMKACIGFEDQNGKKVAITAANVADYRPIVNENSIISTHTTMVTSSKSASATGRKTANVTENVSQSSNASRPVGKRRKTVTEVGNKRGTYRTHASTDLIQVAGNEGQVQDSKNSSTGLPPVSSTTLRGNSRLTNATGAVAAAAKQTPATSRRSVRQNHLTRRGKSPAAVADDGCPSLASVAANSNNNNCTNKNNNNATCGGGLVGNGGAGTSGASATCNSGGAPNASACGGNATGKISFSNNGAAESGAAPTAKGVAGGPQSVATSTTVADKTEATKASAKVNYVTKKEPATGAESKGGCPGANCAAGAAATVTTRGNSVKQTHAVNDSAIAAPPHDLSHTHTAPASEEVINTRRKTRSIAANLNDSEHGSNKRRRNSRDGK